MMGGPGMMGGSQGGPGQMGGPGMSRDSSGPEGGPAMAMMDAVARLNLTAEQRAKLSELRTDLTHRQQELLEKISVAASKLQEITREQARASRGLSDLRGHLIHANLDTANRAEEMLTDEQRQALMGAGAHVMTPEQGH
jgi:Spy/CpxP family protein refolding chaperone